MNTSVPGSGAGAAGSGSVEQRVLAAIQDVLALSAPPGPGARLRDELLLSSMDAMALVLTLEDEFGESLSDEAMESIDTVADLVAMIEARVS